MRYLVTGGSGYIGSRLVERLSQRDDVERILICDVRPPASFRPKAEYQQLDVTDKARVREVVEREKPDVLVHLAFLLNPIHDLDRMYEVDVGGTQNVLEAAESAGVQQMLVTSSATAYGAFPDNPVPITEEQTVRGVPDFEYARDKAECDRLCQIWALRNPDRVMTIVRPCIVLGPNVNNYIVRLWTDQPFQMDVGGGDTPMQFVHEDDLVEGLMLLMDGRHGGAFNVGGDGTISINECGDIIGMKRRKMPLGVAWKLAGVMWKLHQSETPPGNLHFALHPWVVSNDKLKSVGWAPRHSTRETFEIAMRARGKLPVEGADSASVPTPAQPVGA
ncbi:MAG TPA: NAD-dependent epimerase/dehydratase family protein [Thermoleophilaceae bacterium]